MDLKSLRGSTSLGFRRFSCAYFGEKGLTKKEHDPNEDRAVGDIEDGIGISPKHEIKHVYDMAVDKIIDDIAKSAGCNQHEREFTISACLDEEKIGQEPSDNRHSCVK